MWVSDIPTPTPLLSLARPLLAPLLPLPLAVAISPGLHALCSPLAPAKFLMAPCIAPGKAVGRVCIVTAGARHSRERAIRESRACAQQWPAGVKLGRETGAEGKPSAACEMRAGCAMCQAAHGGRDTGFEMLGCERQRLYTAVGRLGPCVCLAGGWAAAALCAQVKAAASLSAAKLEAEHLLSSALVGQGSDLGVERGLGLAYSATAWGAAAWRVAWGAKRRGARRRSGLSCCAPAPAAAAPRARRPPPLRAAAGPHAAASEAR